MDRNGHPDLTHANPIEDIPMSNEVTTTKEAQLPAGLMKDMEADAATHGQTFTPDQLIIPRIAILQDLSPQVKSHKAEYVDGAKPGMIFNNVAGTLDGEIWFTPSQFFVRYIAWQENRGGLITTSLTKDEVEENFSENGVGQWTGLITPRGKKDAVRVDVIETPEWVGVATGKEWGPMPVAISFPGTKAKIARKINTTIHLTEIPGKKGPFKPPAFYHKFILRTALEQSGENEWFGWTVTPDGWADEATIAKAKALKLAFEDGTAEVADEGAER